MVSIFSCPLCKIRFDHSNEKRFQNINNNIIWTEGNNNYIRIEFQLIIFIIKFYIFKEKLSSGHSA